ncbi:phosphatidylethanolamine-binding protein [Schizophyllum commune]
MAALHQTTPSLKEVIEGLREHSVFPDVLPYSTAQELKGVLEIRYPSGISITAGQKPHRDEVQGEPSIRFHPSTALDSAATYTLIMADPDLMKRNDPLDKEVRHWVQPGLKPAAGNPTLTRTDPTVTRGGGPSLVPTRPPHTAFLPSAPMPGTGPHRYVFILAKETRKDVGTGERGGNADFAERLKFDATAFIREHGLEVVGVAVMEVAPTAGAGVDDAKLMAESAMHKVVG